MDLTKIDAAFKSDEISFVKLVLRQHLLELAYDKLLDASYAFSDTECDIDDPHEVLPHVVVAYQIYDFFLYPEASIRDFIQEAFDEHSGISEEDLEKLWEAL